MCNPETSIVIRTFNEEKHLPQLIKAIGEQEYRDYEVVVVDSGSFDQTREIAERNADKLVHINSEDFTFGYSLNIGIEAGAGQYVVIVSAHTRPVDQFWLGRLVQRLRSDGIAMAFGRQMGPAVSKFSEVQDLQRTFGTQPVVLELGHLFANNANSAIRRDLWLDHRFDEALLGLEDIEWAKHWMDRGYRVEYEPAAAVYHIHEESWAQVQHRYYREAVAARNIGLRRQHDVIPTLLSESQHLISDLVGAAQQRVLARRAGEIGRFRYHKAKGTISGLSNGTLAKSPATRHTMLFDRIYRAVVINAPRRAGLEDVQASIVKPGDVLVQVAYAGVCGADVSLSEGTVSQRKSQYPVVPGHEVSGRVVRVGANTSRVHEGDLVTVERFQSCGQCTACLNGTSVGCSNRRELGLDGRRGGYAEYLTVQGRFVHRLPADTDLRIASQCEPLAAAVKGLRRISAAVGSAHPPKKCTVVGAGPIGHLLARLLAMRGHQVTIYERDPGRRAHFRGTPVRVSDDLEPAVHESEVVVVATGDPEVLHSTLAHSSPESTLLLQAAPYEKRWLKLADISSQDKTIVGSRGSEAQDFQEAIALLPTLDLSAFLQRLLPLEEFKTAWAETTRRSYLKVLLEIDGSFNGTRG